MKNSLTMSANANKDILDIQDSAKLAQKIANIIADSKFVDAQEDQFTITKLTPVNKLVDPIKDIMELSVFAMMGTYGFKENAESVQVTPGMIALIKIANAIGVQLR